MTIKIVPVTDLRRKTSAVLESVERKGEVVYITQHGRPVAVLVDYEKYERLLAHVQDLSRRLAKRLTEDIPDYTAHLAGLHNEIWEGVDTNTYLHQEREAWDPSTRP